MQRTKTNVNQSILDFSEIVKEGWIMKRSRYLKRWRNRWLVLTPTHLITFKKQQGYNNKPTEKMSLDTCGTIKSADEELKRENCFRLDHNLNTFYFKASNQIDKEQWIGAIGRNMMKPGVLMDQEEYDFMNNLS